MKLIGKIADQGLSTVDRPHFLTGHHKVPRIWIVVADRHVMKVFRKPDGHLEQIGEASPHHVAPKNNSFGHIVSSASRYIRHRLERRNSPRDIATVKFAQEIGQWLEDAASVDAFDRLVLVAAPKMLGDIRKRLPHIVQCRIVAEVDKDLTKMGERQLKDELQKILWF